MKSTKTFLFSAAAILFILAGVACEAELITLHSGNGIAGGQDSLITFISGYSYEPMSAEPFDSQDFLDAQCGASTYIPENTSPWVPSLPGDPDAKWVAANSSRSAASTLFVQRFTIQTQSISSATLSFQWSADDMLGDPSGNGQNQAGVYLNGTPILAIFGGDWNTVLEVSNVDVTGLVHPGSDNFLYVYDRDLYAVASGVIYSATIDVVPEPATVCLLGLGGLGLLRKHRL